MNKLYLLSILTLLFACNSNNDEKTVKDSLAVNSESPKTTNTSLEEGTFELNEESFGHVIELKGKEQKLDLIFKPNEVDMLIKGDLLIMKTYGNDKFFNIFSLPDFKLINSFGLHGDGPNEFNFPNLVPTDEPDKLCYIYDSYVQKFYYITNDFKVVQCTFSFPHDNKHGLQLKQIYVLSDKQMLYVSPADKGKKIYSFNTDSFNTETELNNLAIEKQYKNWAAYEGNFGVNKMKDRMVYAYKYFRKIKILNLYGTKERLLVLEHKKPKTGDAISMLGPDNITYYWKMSQSDENFYLSYSGRTPIEVTKDFRKDIDYIHIEEFDWNGNPKRKFKLDKWGYFCVDAKRNKLYLVATNADEPFYVYDLGE